MTKFFVMKDEEIVDIGDVTMWSDWMKEEAPAVVSYIGMFDRLESVWEQYTKLLKDGDLGYELKLVKGGKDD